MTSECTLKVTSQVSSDVYLYVKSEPFDIGIVPVSLPPKLTHHNLRKLYAYAKNKGKAGYPRISYTVWKHVACNKLQIEEQLAWLYFYSCEILTEYQPEYHMNNSEEISRVIDNKEVIESFKEKRTVDLLKFILFLYVQRAHVISLKSSVITGDEYPSKNRLQDLEGRAAIGAKGIDENSQMTFLVSNLSEILDLLVEPESYSDDNDALLSIDAVNKLSYLIGAYVEGSGVLSIGKIASLQKHAFKSGYSKISQMFSYRRFHCWISSNIQTNPFGIFSCLSYGQKLRGRGDNCGDESITSSLNTSWCDEFSVRQHINWPFLHEKLSRDIEVFGSLKSSQSNLVNRILSNANFAPESSKLILCNQICRQTVARNGITLSSSKVKIHRCQHSYLYLMSFLRSVMIEKCHNTTIFVGAVETMVNVVACDNIHLIGTAKKLIINACRNSVFQICTPSNPIIVGKTSNIKFAPYYTCYPNLENDMNEVGLVPEPNYWNQPVVINPSKSANTVEVWKVVLPNDFQKFVIPFDLEGSTAKCPMHLPQRYKEALSVRTKRIEEWHKLIRESGLKKQQRTQLQSLVNDKFQKWLLDTGYSNLLESLAPPTPPTAPR